MPRKKTEPSVKKEKVSKQVTVSSGENKVLKVQTRKSSKLVLEVFDTKGKVAGSVDLPREIFGSTVNKQLLAQAVRVYLANQRRGTASTKTRGEVQGSSRKIYRQKGTGRARMGSARSPIRVHGGIVFGPKPRDYSLKFSKKMKRKALSSALSAKLAEKNIKVVMGLEKIEPKTKIMAQVIEALGLDKKTLLLILPALSGEKVSPSFVIERSARNIEGVTIRAVNQLNTFEVLRNNYLLFAKSAIESLGENKK